MSRIAMVVFNDVRFDSRVLREAATLAAAGHDVTVYGRLTESGVKAGHAAREGRQGFAIIRVPVSPNPRHRWVVLRHYPWRLRGWIAGLFLARVAEGPRGWARALVLALLAIALLPWAAFCALRYIARGGPGSHDPVTSDVLDWLAWWLTVVGPWGRAVAATIVSAPGLAPEVIHAHDLTGLVAARAIEKRLAAYRSTRPGLVYDSHEILLESGRSARQPSWARALIAAEERAGVRRAAAVVAVNDGIAAEMQRRYRPRRVLIVHNCPPRWSSPDVRPDLIRRASGIPADVRIVLYHGGFSPDRGIEELLEAVHLVPDTALVCLGYGALEQRLRAWADEPRHAGRLFVLPAVAPSQLLDWVASADVVGVLIQPTTLNHRLSTPNKFLEAMAAGVPTVVSDAPGMSPIVRETGSGITVDPHDVAAIAAAIRSIVDAPSDERAAWRARALAAAHRKYNWETESGQLLELYTSIATGEADRAQRRP